MTGSRLRGSLGSKIARRTLLLFFICTLVPVIVLTIQHRQRIQSLFDTQQSEELQRSAKGMALVIFERFLYIERQLEALQLAPTSGADDNIENLLSPKLRAYFDQVYLLPARADAIRSSLDSHASLPMLKGSLESGASFLLSSGTHPNGEFWFAHRNDALGAERLLMARISESYLWQGLYNYDLLKVFGVFTASGDLLFTTGDAVMLWDDDAYVSDVQQSRWPMFTGEIGMPERWTIVARMSRQASKADDQQVFQRTTLSTTVLLLLLATLAGTYSIRKSTEPVRALREGIRRIRDRDFTYRVDIKSNDEYEMLGGAFNSMSDKLNQHISAIRALYSIDQHILGKLKIENIVDVVLREGKAPLKAQNLFLLVRKETTDAFVMYSTLHAGTTDLALSDETLSALHRPEQVIRWSDTGLSEPAVTAQMNPEAHLNSVHLVANDQVKAVMITEFAEEPDADMLNITALFADHVAFAFSNADWESRLYREAHFDALTGLPNRFSFNERLQNSLNVALGTNQGIAILLMDIDDFSMINEAVGQEGGDLLLTHMARRSGEILGTNSWMARLGGDEFALVVHAEHSARARINPQIAPIADELQEIAREGVTVGGRKIEATVSIGIALCPADAENTAELLQQALQAKQQAKELGKGRACYYGELDSKDTVNRLDFIQAIRTAIAEDQLELFYQPKVDAMDGSFHGCEALIRWNHPERGLLSPFFFILQAEQYGLADEIGQWVIRAAARQQAQWLKEGVDVGRVAVNVSVLQLVQENFCDDFLSILHAAQCPRESLEVEITETAYVEDMDNFRSQIETLGSAGVSFSVDDYGTGYSSLSMLLNLPVDQLKIDKSFIDDLEHSNKSQAIVETTILLAKRVGYSVVAEGVETLGQLRALQALGCDTIQGYYFSKPVRAAELATLASSGHFEHMLATEAQAAG